MSKQVFREELIATLRQGFKTVEVSRGRRRIVDSPIIVNGAGGHAFVYRDDTLVIHCRHGFTTQGMITLLGAWAACHAHELPERAGIVDASVIRGVLNEMKAAYHPTKAPTLARVLEIAFPHTQGEAAP